MDEWTKMDEGWMDDLRIHSTMFLAKVFNYIP